MAQDYLSLVSTIFPFRLIRPSTPLSAVVVVAPCAWTWASDNSDGGYDPAVANQSTARTVYAVKTFVFDTTQYSWLLLAPKDMPYPVVAHEADFLTFDSLVGGDWGILGRIAGNLLYPISQI